MSISSILVAMCIYVSLVIMSAFSFMRVGSLLCAFINLSGLCSKLVLIWMSLKAVGFDHVEDLLVLWGLRMDAKWQLVIAQRQV